VYDSIINKTPLTYRTNRIIGGSAPSIYLDKLEAGSGDTPPIAPDKLDSFLRSHLIDPAVLRANDFERFMRDRQQRLLALIENATGQAVHRGEEREEGEDAEDDEDAAEAHLTIAAE
jgi:hypothetical protein